MFIKLMVLILVVGSSGVGVLSVRQSRLQAAHETAETRLRIRKLENRTTELKAAIAELATPGRVVSALEASKQYTPAMHKRATLSKSFTPINEHAGPDGQTPEVWFLDDGTQVLIIREEHERGRQP